MLKKQNWAPGHLASALKLYPYDQSPNPQPLDPKEVKRWAYFLKKVVGNQQFKDIKQKLAEAILSPNFVSISFSHRESDRAGLLVIDTPVGSSLNGPFARHLTLSTINVPAGKEDDFDKPPTTPQEPDPLPSPPWQKPRP